jgi:hypothetical protein
MVLQLRVLSRPIESPSSNVCLFRIHGLDYAFAAYAVDGGTILVRQVGQIYRLQGFSLHCMSTQ